MDGNKYIYISYANAYANYEVEEEHSYIMGGICVKFYVYDVSDSKQVHTAAVIEASYADGRLVAESLFVAPEHRGHGIEFILIDHLRKRFGTECEPPFLLTDDEVEFWQNCLSSDPAAPPVGHLALRH